MLTPFVACLTEELVKRRYGDKRQAQIVDRFEGLTRHYQHIGAVDPEAMAMARVLDELTEETARKNRMNYTALRKLSDIKGHFDSYTGPNEARAAAALLTVDAQSRSSLNAPAYAEIYKKQLWAGMTDILDRIGKGKFGMQKGKAYLDNLVDEIYGKTTGDTVAADLAKSWNTGTGMVVDLWKMAGGEMNRLENWGLPQLQSFSKMLKNGGKNGADWVTDHMQWMDWDKMRWPNGAPIEVADRQRALQEAFKTLASDGVNKIDPTSFKGNGHALGNMVDEHRFLIYKDGEAWRGAHEKYGDGNVFDVMTGYIADISHKMGLVKVLGNNPVAMVDTIASMAEKRAYERGGAQAAAEVKAALATRYKPMAEVLLRQNGMDPESTAGNLVLGTGNVLTAIQLTGAVLSAMPGDVMTTMVVRAFNHLPVLPALTTTIHSLVKPAEMVRLSAQSAAIGDEVIHSIYSKSRFSGLAEYGPAFTKRMSDFILRASGLNHWTYAVRWANQAETMGALAAERGTAFDDLAFKGMMQRYGITARDWDTFRAIKPWEPYPGVERLRPSDLLSNKNNQDVFEKFQMMILQESRYAVPDSTLEATVALKGTNRPNTMPGAILHSFAMYKNFPMTLALTYGRLAMDQPSAKTRWGFYAAMGSSLILGGAVGLQLRELSKGRDPLPINLAFAGKAALASGAMSVWGDMIFNGVNNFSRSPADVAAGPIVGFLGDTSQLAFGSMFDFADKLGTLKADKAAHTPWLAKATEYASRYTPGTNLWFARAALQRELFDPLRALSDPRGESNMMRREQKRVRDFGNESWWAPNTAFPQRAPGLPVGVQ